MIIYSLFIVASFNSYSQTSVDSILEVKINKIESHFETFDCKSCSNINTNYKVSNLKNSKPVYYLQVLLKNISLNRICVPIMSCSYSDNFVCSPEFYLKMENCDKNFLTYKELNSGDSLILEFKVGVRKNHYCNLLSLKHSIDSSEFRIGFVLDRDLGCEEIELLIPNYKGNYSEKAYVHYIKSIVWSKIYLIETILRKEQ